MRWNVKIPAEIEVYFESYGDENDAAAEAIGRVRNVVAGIRNIEGSAGISIKPAYLAVKPKGTPEPDPRD